MATCHRPVDWSDGHTIPFLSFNMAAYSHSASTLLFHEINVTSLKGMDKAKKSVRKWKQKRSCWGGRDGGGGVCNDFIRKVSSKNEVYETQCPVQASV